MSTARLLVVLAVILAAVASRLAPHPPNFTPIAAMALFAGAYVPSGWQAFVVPLAAMLLSDLLVGWHPLAPVVYASFALIVCIGFWLRPRKTGPRVAVAAVAGSVAFFLITNFAVWAFGSFYPKSLEGLFTAYVAGLPFFRNTLLGDVFYVAVLFGGFAILERLFAALRESPIAAGSHQ